MSNTNFREPVSVPCVGWKVVVVNLDAGSGLTKNSRNLVLSKGSVEE